MTQREEVLNYMREHGSITRIESFYRIGVTELSSRIGEIERIDKVRINRKPITIKARNGRTVNITKYSISEIDNNLEETKNETNIH